MYPLQRFNLQPMKPSKPGFSLRTINYPLHKNSSRARLQESSLEHSRLRLMLSRHTFKPNPNVIAAKNSFVWMVFRLHPIMQASNPRLLEFTEDRDGQDSFVALARVARGQAHNRCSCLCCMNLSCLFNKKNVAISDRH